MTNLQNAPAPQNSTSMAALKARTQNLPPDTPLGFFTAAGLDLMQRAANLLANSTLVPESYQSVIRNKKTGEVRENRNAISNCVLALNMAQRLGADPLMIMQHLYIVDGHPAWSSQFVISAINTCGRFSPLRFDLQDLGEQDIEYEVIAGWKQVNGKSAPVKEKMTEKVKNYSCRAWVIEKATGERLDGPEITIEMAVKEGWYHKTGSKWQTMPQVMLRYRAASFFGKLYAPELLMGLTTQEEAEDKIITVEPVIMEKDNNVHEMTLESLEEEKPRKKARQKGRKKGREAGAAGEAWGGFTPERGQGPGL